MNRATLDCGCGTRILALDGVALYCNDCGAGPFCIPCYLKHMRHERARIAPQSKASDWAVDNPLEKAMRP
jgi:hypothetical protein